MPGAGYRPVCARNFNYSLERLSGAGLESVVCGGGMGMLPGPGTGVSWNTPAVPVVGSVNSAYVTFY